MVGHQDILKVKFCILYFCRRSQYLEIDSIERYLTFSFLLCLTSLHPEMRYLIKSYIFFECLQRFYYTFLMVPISVCRIKMLAHQEVRCHDLPIIKNLPKSKPIFSKYSPLSRSNLSLCCVPVGGYQGQLSVPTGRCLPQIRILLRKAT